MKRTVLWTMVLVFTALVTGCSANTPATRQIDDAVLASQVRDALADDAQLRAFGIVVDAKEGVVTLMGRVDMASQKQRAVDVARGVAGVAGVRDQLTVR